MKWLISQPYFAKYSLYGYTLRVIMFNSLTQATNFQYFKRLMTCSSPVKYFLKGLNILIEFHMLAKNLADWVISSKTCSNDQNIKGLKATGINMYVYIVYDVVV